MQKLSVLVIRLFALFVLYQALSSFKDYGSNIFFQGNNELDLILTLASFFSLLILFIVLFFFAKKISNYIVPKTGESKLELDNYQSLAAVLFSSFGLFIIYSSTNMLLGSISQLMIMYEVQEQIPFSPTTQVSAFFFGGVLQMIAGILLFTRGSKLSKWWYKSKY
tara:strand:- start:502 stop:996 length:495 start_codon:yes stop_codon:yes gene_type:complete